MSETLIDVLINDHRRIQSMAKELREECGKPGASEGGFFNRFRSFKALAVAHAKAEEYTIYALFDDNAAKAQSYGSLREFVLEAYEEHDLVDLMLKEMGQAEELTDQFRAKLKVLSELLDHHIEQEEREFLPKVREILSQQELMDLAVVYSRERDEIFAKKSGLKKPASIYNPRNLTTH